MSAARRRVDHFGERAEAREQPLGERLGVAARDGAEQHQLEQFVVGQRLGAALAEALAQPLAMARVIGDRLPETSERSARLGSSAAVFRHRSWRVAQLCPSGRASIAAASRGPPARCVKISQPVSVTPTRVLELRRQRAVARHRRPAVGQHLHVRPAEVDHRLDGEEHAGLEHDALAGLAEVQDVGPVVEHAAEAVAAEVAHDAAALALRRRPGSRRRCRRWCCRASPPRCRACSAS